MLRDLFVMRQRAQLLEREVDGVVDQPADPKPAIHEVCGEQGCVLLGVGEFPVAPEIRRDVALGVDAGRRIDVLEQPRTGPISANPTRCTTRGCRNVSGVAATQPTMSTTIESAKTVKPIQLSSSRPP